METSIKKHTRTKGVLEHYEISSMTLWRWEQHPDFPQALRRGHVKLFDLAAIEAWLEKGAK